MSVRSYKWTIGILLGALVLLAWRYFVLTGQVITADFIDKECKITDDSVRGFEVATPRDLAGPAHDLEFLMGYYEYRSKSLAGSRLEQIVRRDYEQTLSNAVALFRRESTNDLGDNPQAWIQKYRR